MPEDDSLNRAVYDDCSIGVVVMLVELINNWDCVMQVVNESRVNINNIFSIARTLVVLVVNSSQRENDDVQIEVD